MIVDLSDKVAIVTGAGQGIGEGIARVFAKAGAKIVIATRSRANGQSVADSIVKGGGVAWLNQTDVGRHAEVKRVVAETVERFGRLDIVVHNAAVYPVLPIEQLSDADLDLTLSVNLKAGFWLIQESLPHLRKRGGGRFLFTSSVTGPNVAMPGTAHYAASKCGINGLIRTAALRSEEHTSELQSRSDLVCRLLLETKKRGWGRAVGEKQRHHARRRVAISLN